MSNAAIAMRGVLKTLDEHHAAYGAEAGLAALVEIHGSREAALVAQQAARAALRGLRRDLFGDGGSL